MEEEQPKLPIARSAEEAEQMEAAFQRGLQKYFRRQLNKDWDEVNRLKKKKLAQKQKRRQTANKSRNINRLKARLKK